MNDNSQKVALITGITGQDGSYLAEFLLDKGYEVHGILRRSSSFNTGRIEHLYLDEWVRDMKQRRLINLHYGDMTDSSSLIRIIEKTKPDEIYNLAAQSHVKVSFDVPEYTAETDAVGTLRLIEAVRIAGREQTTKIYQASTSELFGKVQEIPQRETTPFYPRSPYGCAKLYSFWIMKNYRESYGMFCANGILFNHESERRGETFVTRKITFAAARIAHGLQDKLYLGNLNALRDWGYARDYVLKACRSEVLHEVRHAAAFELEYALRVAVGYKLVDLGIIEVHRREIDVGSVVLLYHAKRVSYDREVSEAQEVHLQKTQLLYGRHVELRRDALV